MRTVAGRGPNWSVEENLATIDAYLALYRAWLVREQVSKQKVLRETAVVLDGRTESAVSRKFSNISSVFHELQWPWLPGYKPLANIQRSLVPLVANAIKHSTWLSSSLDQLLQERVVPGPVDIFWADPVQAEFASHLPTAMSHDVKAAHWDFSAIEASNRSLGWAGERLVLADEIERLKTIGLHDLARKVDHVSDSQGDGFGFDILSFHEDGRKKRIEVKTTTGGLRAPFYISRNELRISQDEDVPYELARLHDVQMQEGQLVSARGYRKLGPIGLSFDLVADSFLAYPAAS